MDIVDKTAAENQHPPSSYCEVILNDKLVYRTRTKQVTPLPYFNAVSERFIRDWTMAKVTFAVRDERDREHGMSLRPLAEGVIDHQIRCLVSSTSLWRKSSRSAAK